MHQVMFPLCFVICPMQLSEARHCECAETLRWTKWAPRVDAQASDIRTGIGGSEPKLNKHGVPDKSKSRWFTLEITKEKMALDI